jgi:hypothetical protein
MTDRMFSTRRLSEILAILIVLVAAPTRAQDSLATHHGRGRIVILMVWDGLRPDFVTQRDTPNLFRLAREGVRFDKHHSIFPTLTMVNATALATGAPPGVNGLEGNNFYLPPSAEMPKGEMVGAEGAKAILNLNGSNQFKGRLIGLDTIAQEVAREGGYVGVIGKQGPTSVFDNRVATILDGKDIVGEAHKDYLFASEDLVAPASASEKITIPPDSKTTVADEQRDLYFARLVVENALPAAKLAADAGRPALVVFWQHNPDLTQHVAGLGTLPAMEALSLCDNNLMKLRTAIDTLGIADKTDVIVVSDHGFATIKFRIVLSEMLVAAGIKKSHDSPDVVADGICDAGVEARGAAEDRELCRGAGMVRADLLARFRHGARRAWPPGTSSARAEAISRMDRRDLQPARHRPLQCGAIARPGDLISRGARRRQQESYRPNQSSISDWADRAGLDAKQISRLAASGERTRVRRHRDQPDVHHRHGDAWRGGRARDS